MRRRLHAPKRSIIAALIAAPLLPAWPVGTQAQTATGGATDAPPAESAPAETKPNWQLAPIGWKGQVGLIGSVSDVEGQARRTQFSEIVSVAARSYIWQPWFIQVMGGLGLLLNQTHEGSSGEGSSRGGLSGGTLGVIGNMAVSVFPVSRFPFMFTVDVNDSRASGDFVSSDFRSTRIGLRQSYRTLRGDTSYTASLDHSILTSDDFGRDRVTVLDGQMATAWTDQRLLVNANYSDNVRSSDDLGSRTARVSAQHTWRPEDLVLFDSLASMNRESRRVGSSASGLTSDVRQVSTVLNWRNDWDEPLIVFGSARLYDASTRGGGSTATGRSADLSGSASYRFTPNLNTFAAAAVSYIETDGHNEALTTQAAGAQYQTDPHVWGRTTYTANTGISVGNQTGGELGSRQQAQLQAGHQLLVSIAADQSNSWNLTLGQSGGLNHATDSDFSQILVHTVGTYWRYTPPSGLAGYSSLSIGDSRTFGGPNEGEFQIANFQLSAQIRPGPYSQFSANFTAQASRQTTLQDPERRTSRSTSGGISYQNARAFGVPRLRYTAQFNAYDQKTDGRLLGNPDARREDLSWLFEQRLEYQIGLLDARLTLRAAESDGKKNASLIASVYRRFGR